MHYYPYVPEFESSGRNILCTGKAYVAKPSKLKTRLRLSPSWNDLNAPHRLTIEHVFLQVKGKLQWIRHWHTAPVCSRTIQVLLSLVFPDLPCCGHLSLKVLLADVSLLRYAPTCAMRVRYRSTIWATLWQRKKLRKKNQLTTILRTLLSKRQEGK